MSSTAVPLCEASCGMRGRHRADCADDACRGCLPRQAADGLRLCTLHAERIAEDAGDAPLLYDDLGLVLVRRGGADGEKMSGTSSGAPVPDEAVMEARAAIRSALIQLVRVITGERGIKVPTVERGGARYVDTRPAALADLVARHAQWLAAHRSAGRYADLLHEAVRGDARRLAYPSGSDRMYVGDCPLVVADVGGNETTCGTRLYQTPDQPLIRCSGCGTDETIEQWQSWIVGEAEGVTDAYAAAAYLARRWMRPVDATLIRQWSHRGRIHPIMESDAANLSGTGERWRIVTDGKGRTQYRLADLVAYAETLWGPPFSPGWRT